jgi:glycosyltransferase involved in cell wall biosynthesis
LYVDVRSPGRNPGGEPTEATTAPEVSVVIPCLDEADTLGDCIRAAQRGLADHGIAGEVVVADNGSTDSSREIALGCGARVVRVEDRGYGSALMGGIAASRGRYVVMGDADGSYDFAAVPALVEKLRAGHPLVMGCRLESGGGQVMPGAMPFTHRWIGNPLFSALARRWFGAPIHDVYCGLRGFSRAFYDRLGLRCTGMEFAVEMLVRACLERVPIAEVPIRFSPDGRRAHGPHLRTVRDGWRTLRFFLMYSPRWLFLFPGLGLGLLGAGAFGAVATIGTEEPLREARLLLLAALLVLCGYQAVLFAVFAKTFAIAEGLMPEHPTMRRLYSLVDLEKGLLAGLALGVGGAVLLYLGFAGEPAAPAAIREAIAGATLVALGWQTVLSSFFVSILGLRRR